MNIVIYSIVIPCFNHGQFLEACLTSILSQSEINWEVWIIDDGSSDSTKFISEKFTNQDSRIHFISQSNQGLSAARNTGMKLARGNFLLFLDADDWLEVECLKRFTRLIEIYPKNDLFRCGYAYWDRPNGRKFHAHLSLDNGLIYPRVLTQNIGPCHSILIRRSFAEQLGGFDTNLKSCEDWDFWIRAGKMGAKIISIQEVLVAYRYVYNSMSRNPRVMYDSLSEVSLRAGCVDKRIPQNVLYNHPKTLNFPEIQKNHLITVLGVLLHQGNVKHAVDWYKSEKIKWNWDTIPSDWNRISSYLSWGYFLEESEIRNLVDEVWPNLNEFFFGLGYTKEEGRKLIRMIFAPQLKNMNHIRFGRILGGLLNRLGWY